MFLNLTEYAQAPIQEQIINQITLKIINKELLTGDELEPIGIIAREHRISKNTVKRAFQKLVIKGLLETNDENGYSIKRISDDKFNKIKTEFESAHLLELDPDRINNIYNEAVEKQKYEEELKLARQIQADLIPVDAIHEKGFEITAFIEPSRVVCGDFYDYFKIDETHLGMVIADASGKGMPAAILISQIQAILKSEVGNGSSIEKIISKLNKHLSLNSSARNFTTLFYGIFDSESSTLAFANAGHNFPIVVRENGSFELLKTTGPALGLMKDFSSKTNCLSLNPNDLILFYTDGITETMNETGEQFGEGRLIEITVNNRADDISNLVNTIVASVKSFGSLKFVKDDMTLMIFKKVEL